MLASKSKLQFVFVLLILLLLHGNVYACGGCTDLSISIVFPFAYIPVLLIIVWIWIALVRIFENDCGKKGYINSILSTSKSAKITFALLGSLGFIGFLILTNGSVLSSILLIGTIWLIYVFIMIVLGLILRPRALISKNCLAPHLACFLLVIAFAPISYWRAHSLDRMVTLLNNSVPAKEKVLLPALIAKGEEAVDPLIEACEKSLQKDDWYDKKHVVTSAAYCLVEIGGDKAVNYLGRTIVEKVDFENQDDSDWQEDLCYIYSESGAVRAASNLITLYNKVDSVNPKEWEPWTVLTAIAKTGDPEGIYFVLDHLDVFLRCDLDKCGDCVSENEGLTEITVKALFLDPDLNNLYKIPYNTGLPRFSVPRKKSKVNMPNELYFIGENKEYTFEDIVDLWEITDEKSRREVIENAKARWAKALNRH